MADEDLEEYWAILRPPSEITPVSDRASDLQSQLLLASGKTGFDLASRYKEFAGQELTPDLMAKMLAEGIQVFMDHWYDSLRKQNISGLLEIILEGQSNNLTPTEMTEFIRALPSSLLDKVVKSALGSATGIHALLALERHRRSGTVTYSIESVLGSTQVRFTGPGGQEVSFGLYEAFNLEETPRKAPQGPVV
jgi:hypothetical protein